MQRLADTELPTFTLGTREWNARLIAGYVGDYQRRAGSGPSLRALVAYFAVRNPDMRTETVANSLDLGIAEAEHLGLIRGGSVSGGRGGARRYWVRAA